MYKKKINIVHARSFIPGLIGFILKKINPKIKLIYDIRGFWVDEKIDLAISLDHCIATTSRQELSY